MMSKPVVGQSELCANTNDQLGDCVHMHTKKSYLDKLNQKKNEWSTVSSELAKGGGMGH